MLAASPTHGIDGKFYSSLRRASPHIWEKRKSADGHSHIRARDQNTENRPAHVWMRDLRLSGIFGLEYAVPTKVLRTTGENDPAFRPTLKYEWLCPWASTICECADGIRLICWETLQECIEAYACNRVRESGARHETSH